MLLILSLVEAEIQLSRFFMNRTVNLCSSFVQIVFGRTFIFKQRPASHFKTAVFLIS